MTEHLPECLALLNDSTWDGDCICEALRACEQRVRIESQAWHYRTGYNSGFADALDAAEAAVADIDGEEMCCACNDDYRMTIDAIRALKEKP